MLEEIKSMDIEYEYAAKYCYDIIQWNLKHCPLISNCVIIDNLNCFQYKIDVIGATSILFNVKKNELVFQSNIVENFIYSEIKNKQIYDSFTVEKFKEQFIYFYSLVNKFVRLKEIKYCTYCFCPTYQLTFKQLCKVCHINQINTKINCENCKKVEIREKKFKFASLFKFKKN
jgi:hypothetical protein